MKILLTLFAICGVAAASFAQERLARQEALKYAFYTCADLKQMTSTPLPTDPDPKRPVAIRHGNHGLLLLPEVKLSASAVSGVGATATPIGQLWLVKIAPVVDGASVPASKLRMVDVKTETGEGTVACCALALRKKGDAMELLVYGKGTEPLIATPAKSISGQFDAETPLDISAEVEDQNAKLTLKIAGKYEAVFPVGRAED